MKKTIFGIITIAIGSLFSLPIFAQINSYSDCSITQNGTIICTENQSCNNPDGICFCSKTSLMIPHNTTCFDIRPDKIIRTRTASSYAISGSIVSFRFAIQNTVGTKKFVLELPRPENNPRIKITSLTQEGLDNGIAVSLNQFTNPIYSIPSGERKIITITGEVVSNSFVFERITINPCIRNIGSTSCIDQIPTFIFPIANYSIEKRLIEPKPIFIGEKANYEIIIKSNGSKIANAVSLATTLGNFLGNPVLTHQGIQINPSLQNGQNYSRNNIFSSMAPGQSRILNLNTEFVSEPTALTKITTKSTITNGRELTLSDNIATNEFIIPTIVDVVLEKVEIINDDPEILGDEIGFLLTFANYGNTGTQNLNLEAYISGTDYGLSTIPLEELGPNQTGNFTIKGIVDQNYPIGSKLCFSGKLIASNETEGLENNSISSICYTFIESADITVSGKLSDENFNNIINGSNLNYEIKVSNQGGKTARGVILRLYPSQNQSPQTPTIITGITLKGGESKSISFVSKLNNYPVDGTKISLSGEVSFTGIDLDPNNNSFDISYELPGLSDIWVKIDVLPFNGFKSGDQIIYNILYGNSGHISALNPIINFTKPPFVVFEQNEISLGKSLPAGETITFVVTGTLNQLLSVGTEITTEVKISTDSAQVTEENDADSVSVTVIENDDISFGASIYNNTRPSLTIDPQTNIQAVSGDIISFVVSYNNVGNVPANNVVISLANIGPIVLQSYNPNIGNIGIGQQSSINITGQIIGRNFNPISPIISVSYNNTSFSRTFSIVEKVECGDGLITGEEPCDTLLNINYGTGQECQNQNGTCVLVTKYIVNTACVEFGNNVVCDDAIINLEDPRCAYLDVRGTPNSTSVLATCVGQYTRPYTLIRISCGDGNIFTGFASSIGLLATTCNYSSVETAQNAIISCGVGNDTNNPNCIRSVMSCDLYLDSRIVILDENEGSVLVQCSTNNGQEASLEIDCGNGTSSTANGSTMQHICEYTDNDLYANQSSRIMDISCNVNGVRSCDDELILDQGIMGVCGDGIRQGYEQCDLPNGTTIGRYLDLENLSDAPISVMGKKCYNCYIQDETPAQCLSVHNGNISIEKGEFLPFWWRVNTTSFARSTDCSYDSDKGKIIASTMRCTFEIQKPGGSRIEILERKCISNPDDTYKIFNYFNQYFSANTWRYAVNPNIFNSFVGSDLGEYKLRLKEVTYEYCDEELEINSSQTDNVCETNFTITKPYLVQKSAFGMTPKATDIDLENFYDISRNPIINKTDLADVMILDANNYNNSAEIDLMVGNFVQRMENLAVNISSANLPQALKDAGVRAKKVPNQDIYILEGGSTIIIKPATSFTKPFTLIVKENTLIIEGDIDVNGMFIVRDGSIRFDDDECNRPQTVKGIFIADNFWGTKNTNDSLYKERCNAGGLHVKGVLIGGGIQTLVNNKRSNLSRWFYVSGGSNTIRIQRRNMIFNGASVLIEYSPELWQQLPPGADDFTKALEIYKR